MAASFQIRRAERRDLPALVEFNLAMARETEGRELEWSDWLGAPFGWIQSVFVTPAFRGRGAYRAMHEHVAKLARDAGACGLRLYVEKHNQRARRVYEFLGMRETPYDLLEIEF